MARLRDVEAPDRLAEGWSTFLDGVQEAFDLIPELAAATRDDDKEKLAELTSGSPTSPTTRARSPRTTASRSASRRTG